VNILVLSRWHPLPLILYLFRYLPSSPFPPFTKKLANADYDLASRKKDENKIILRTIFKYMSGSCGDTVILAKKNMFGVKLVSSSGTCTYPYILVLFLFYWLLTAAYITLVFLCLHLCQPGDQCDEWVSFEYIYIVSIESVLRNLSWISQSPTSQAVVPVEQANLMKGIIPTCAKSRIPTLHASTLMIAYFVTLFIAFILIFLSYTVRSAVVDYTRLLAMTPPHPPWNTSWHFAFVPVKNVA
jgi:hypothetical protein